MKFYLVYKNHGLYDPVLDDQEPIYEYELEDLGPQSEPTEVSFKIQQFVEPSDLGSELLDFGSSPLPGTTNIALSESRSLTASPFLIPTKPYRAFSTEPVLEVPPLEDPIILNPNHRDEFGKSPADFDPDYIINAHYKNSLGHEGKFKLPISEKYDPDGKRVVQNIEVIDKLLKYEKHVKCLSKDVQVFDVNKETKVNDTVTKNLTESLIESTETQSTNVEVSKSWKKEKKDVQISEAISKHKESTPRDIQAKENKEIFKEGTEEKSIKEEFKYIEKNNQDIDLEKIEKTALSVVEDSISQAVSVAEEIKKEIDVELGSSEVEAKSEQVVSEYKQKEISKPFNSEMSQESAKIIDEIENIQSESHDKGLITESNSEYIERKINRAERVEVQEETSQHVASKDVNEFKLCENKIDSKERKSFISEGYDYEEIVEKPRRKESSEHKTLEENSENKREFKEVTKTVTAGAKSNKKEQSAYNIGLQTIPNIRGVAHSSYHYDLLLRTFFIHLTDVMVALSRFVLTQPIFNKLAGKEECVTETCTYESGARNSEVQKSYQELFEAPTKVEKLNAEEIKMQVETTQKRKEVVKPKQVIETVQEMKVQSVHAKNIERKEIVQPLAIKHIKQEVNTDENNVKQDVKLEKTDKTHEQKMSNVAEMKEIAVVSDKQLITGAQMAQRSERKLSQELTQKMDAVISEFQTIAAEDVKKEMLEKNRRSRSRSQIEEEVMKESDPLEWLAKVDSGRSSQERTEISEKDLLSTNTVKKRNKIDSKPEMKQKTPKQTYIAIVESHVYTNKDAIFEQQIADFSKTSVQSAEEIKTVFEGVEVTSTENVALENAIKELEAAKILEDSREQATFTAKSSATVEKIEDVMHDSKENIQEEIKKETAIQSGLMQEVLIHETQEVIEPVTIIKKSEVDEEQKIAVDINKTLSVAESTELDIHESNSEFYNVEMKKETVAIVEEDRAAEKMVESEVKVVEPKPVQVVEVTETVVLKLDKQDVKPVHDEYAALKIVKKVESDIILSPEIIEVEDISELALTSESVIDNIDTRNQLAVAESTQIISKSIVDSELVIGETGKKEESVVDNSQVSLRRSSQVGLSSVKNELEVSKTFESENKITEATVKESSFTANSVDRKLSLRLDLERQMSIHSPPSTINTPTPSTVPPTPLTDEYVFKLSLPLPKSRSATPVPRDSTLSPEDEDPHIVKKKLIPHIETTIERVLYDPPLPTPPAEKVQSPVYTKPVLNGGAIKVRLPIYTKPGLRGGAIQFPFPVYKKPGLFGGADKSEYSKEEIREIERKSSLLASAIDETIKSIEEYKEEVGIESKKELKGQELKKEKNTKSCQKSNSKKVTVESKINSLPEVETRIEEIIDQCNALEAINNAEAVNTGVEEINNNQKESGDIEVEIKKESIKIESQPTKSDSEIGDYLERRVQFKNEVNNIEENAVEVVNHKTAKVESKYSVEETVLATETTKPTATINIRQTEDVTLKKSGKEVSAIILESKEETVRTDKVEDKTEKSEALLGFKPVIFDPEAIQKYGSQRIVVQEPTRTQEPRQSPYMTETGEPIGTTQGIVDGLEDPVMDEEVAKQLGKPGISEEKIAVLISGEAEMLREAHVMGLSRVLTSHMHRADDSSEDFEKIKPSIDSLKDSEVLKALNEEMARQKAEEKKKEEKRWTTFLQKPRRPVPKAKFGYPGWTEDDQVVTEPYKVKIVKQAKPKVAPDYKPEDFETGPLPWEERAATDSLLPPLEPEEPILIPEVPEFLEAVDPLPESEIPDLEDTGIPLPPPRESTPPPIIEEQAPEIEPEVQEVPEEETVEEVEEKQETTGDMENRLAEQLVRSVQGMIDPNASIEQQLSQMRAQLAALAQLPEVIQQSLELVTNKLSKMNHQEAHDEATNNESQNYQVEENQNNGESEMQTIQEENENSEPMQNGTDNMTIEEVQDKMEMGQQNMMQEQENMRMTSPMTTEEEIRMRKRQAKLEHESRQIKQHPTPRAGTPKRMFGPLDPEERMAVILPGGRRWKKTQDVYDEQKINEILQAQSELLLGKTMGFESDPLPYDNRINFMKYEKPPVSLDHLKHSEVYKLIHDMDQAPPTRFERRTPVMCEADYRERCRSMTPAVNKHLQIPQQFHP